MTCCLVGMVLASAPGFVNMGQEWWRYPDPACKQCGGRMEMAADISPQGREPGLRAFVCSECGTVDSVLIRPDVISIGESS